MVHREVRGTQALLPNGSNPNPHRTFLSPSQCECENNGSHHNHTHKMKASELVIGHEAKRRRPSAPQWIGTLPLYALLIVICMFIYGLISSLTASSLLIQGSSSSKRSGGLSRRKQERLRKKKQQRERAEEYRNRAEARQERNKQWLAAGEGLPKPKNP